MSRDLSIIMEMQKLEQELKVVVCHGNAKGRNSLQNLGAPVIFSDWKLQKSHIQYNTQ